MKLRDLLIATLFVLASVQTAQACGSYQTCNMILIQDMRVTPNPVDSGQPVTIEIDTFEFANWYYIVNSMLFQPYIMVTVGGRQYPAQLSYSSMSSAYPYGYWWYGMIWFTQYAQFTHTFTWDGKDYSGNPVSGDQEIIVIAYAGAAADAEFVTLKVNDSAGKDDGAPCGQTPQRISPLVGDPCNLTTGNTYSHANDYRNGSGELRFDRSYNSRQAGNDYGIGHGWIGQALRHLELSTNRVTVREADGRSEIIQKVDGIWQADADSKITFSQSAAGYTLARNNGSVEQYNSDGQLISTTASNGRTTLYQYDVSGHLSAFSSPDGHTLNFSYHADDHLASIIDPENGQIFFEYDSADNLSVVTYQDGTTRQYHYEDTRHPHHLTAVTDERGVVIASYQYDDSGLATLTTHAMRDDGQYHDAYKLEYLDKTHTIVTDGNGDSVEYTFEENLGARNIVSRIDLSDGNGRQQQFDQRNNLVRSTDALGVTTEYEYNISNQLVRKIEAVASPEQRITEYSYLAPDLSLISSVSSASVFSGESSETSLIYDANHNLLSITKSGFDPGGNPVYRAVNLSYDNSGRIITIDGARTDVNDITTLSYYDCNSGGQCGQLASRTDARGYTTQFTEYDLHGRLIQSVDAGGLETRYSYDNRGRLTTIVQTAIDGGSRQTDYHYDAASNLIETVAPNGAVSRYHYDDNRLLRRVTDASGASIEYDYDLRGNRSVSRIIDPDGSLERSVSYVFGLRDDLQVVDVAGSITNIDHDANGNTTQTINPNGYSQGNEHDQLGRVISQLDALGGISTFHYDERNRTTRVIAPNGATTNYIYDDLGNLLQEQSPDRGTLNYQYNDGGNITHRTDSRGVTALYDYDALGRILSIDLPGTESDVQYTYDSCANGIGRVCNVSDVSGMTSYSYDGFGNKTEVQRLQNGNNYITQYSYDQLGNPLTVIYPDGQQVNFLRDMLGRISGVSTSVNATPLSIASNVQYRGDGRISAMQYGNGLSESRGYDLQGRLNEHNVASTLWRYEYDDNGNLTYRAEGLESGYYTYDPLDRLVAESSVIDNIDYSYDANGNRLALTSSSENINYDYTPVSNQLTAIDGITVTRDGNGNTLDDGTLQYGYTAGGRLRDVQQAGNLLASYQYNALGQRVSKTNANSTTHYHYDQSGHLILETRDDGQAIRSYIWLDEQPIAQINRTMGQGSGKALGINNGKAQPNASEQSVTQVVTWLHTDHLLTPRLGSNESGTVVWQWDADAFGKTPPNDDVDGDGKATIINLRFPGQYYDAETGTHYNYFRDYDPGTGRYIQSDPIGLGGGLNTYAYGRGNPGRYVDPLGLLVTGFYEQSTGHVFLYDSDSGGMISGTFESGGKPYGEPAPIGTYAILNTPRDDYLRLDPMDTNPYDDFNQSNNRWGIRLHKPGQTMGCIADTDANSWEKIKEFILGTKTTNAVSGTSLKTIPYVDIIYGHAPDEFVQYGTFYVTP